MFMPNGYEAPIKEYVEYNDDGELICNMQSNGLEFLPYPIIIDSGAAASVLPEKWCDHVDARETPESKKGQHYTAANGGKIYNRGEKMVTMMSREGHMRNMSFTSCDVKRALGSASAICKQGHTVVFNAPDHPDGSCIFRIESGERM